MKFIRLTLFLLIILLAVFLRFYKLGEIPNGLYVDEAAIGYNAYSFLKTGRDEYGKPWPVFLRSYGSYAPPLYTYATILPVAFLGLNPFAVRFVSAVSGVLCVLLIYLIFKNLDFLNRRFIPEIGAFILAFSPWTIFFSRGAYEANLAFIIVLFSIYFLLLSRRKKI